MARNKYDIDETLQTEFNVSHLKRLAGYIRPYSGDMILIVFNDSVLRIRNGNTKDSYENFDVYTPENTNGIVRIA